MTQNARLFLDSDGVIYPFDHHAEDILGMSSSDFTSQFGIKEFWKRIRHYRDSNGYGFFNSAEPIQDADLLINSVRHLDPTILSGCPFGNWGPEQKREWYARKYPELSVITCMASDKHLHMRAGDVLIDDREKHRVAWEAAGGIWITHTSAEESLRQLREIKPRWFV